MVFLQNGFSLAHKTVLKEECLYLQIALYRGSYKFEFVLIRDLPVFPTVALFLIKNAGAEFFYPIIAECVAHLNKEKNRNKFGLAKSSMSFLLQIVK